MIRVLTFFRFLFFAIFKISILSNISDRTPKKVKMRLKTNYEFMENIDTKSANNCLVSLWIKGKEWFFEPMVSAKYFGEKKTNKKKTKIQCNSVTISLPIWLIFWYNVPCIIPYIEKWLVFFSLGLIKIIPLEISKIFNLRLRR